MAGYVGAFSTYHGNPQQEWSKHPSSVHAKEVMHYPLTLTQNILLSNRITKMFVSNGQSNTSTLYVLSANRREHVSNPQQGVGQTPMPFHVVTCHGLAASSVCAIVSARSLFPHCFIWHGRLTPLCVSHITFLQLVVWVSSSRLRNVKIVEHFSSDTCLPNANAKLMSLSWIPSPPWSQSLWSSAFHLPWKVRKINLYWKHV